MELTEDVPGLPGTYRDPEVVGAGGTAVVFRTFAEQLDRVVAVKVFREGSGGRSPQELCERELESTNHLAGHPNFLVPIDADTTADGRPFLVYDYLPDGSLHDRLVAEGPLTRGDVLRLGVQLGSALATMHEEHQVHGDVKPANVLIGPTGQAVLTDLAGGPSVSARGLSGVTPSYLAPEVVAADRFGPLSDIFALGRTLEVAYTGFADVPAAEEEITEDLETAEPSAASIVLGSLRARSLPTGDEFCSLLERCQRPDPRERPTALELVGLLRDLELAAEATPTEPSLPARLRTMLPAPRRPDTPRRREVPPGLWLAAAVIVNLLLVVVVGVSVLGRGDGGGGGSGSGALEAFAVEVTVPEERDDGEVERTAVVVPALTGDIEADACTYTKAAIEQLSEVRVRFLQLLAIVDDGGQPTDSEVRSAVQPLDVIITAALPLIPSEQVPALEDFQVQLPEFIRWLLDARAAGEDAPSPPPEMARSFVGASEVLTATPTTCDVDLADVWDTEVSWAIAQVGK